MTLTSKCPQCNQNVKSHHNWTAKSPRSGAILITYLFHCKQCREHWREYATQETLIGGQ